MRKTIALLPLLFAAQFLGAQQYRPLPSSALYQKLQQLNVLGTVMYVAAHPDDENTRLLSYLVHHDHVRTVYLSLTRGDGGQNILGNEQGSALGLIRTHELIEARKIDGAEQVFTPVIDFGFTKSPEETFRFWNQEALVADVARAYEQYRPDVVICRFPVTGEGGHGQHTVSAIVAGEAFRLQEAGGRKESRPDSLSGWLPQRLLFNAFRFGDRNTTSADQFRVPINQYDPLLGEGYGEMAGRSRSIHKSQGAGTPQSVGIADEYFKLLAGSPMETSLYDGVDMTWNRVGRAEIGAAIRQVIAAFDFTDPSQSLPALLKIKQQIQTVRDPFWRTQKLKEIDELLLSCAGIMIEALAKEPEATPGSTLPITVNVIRRGAYPLTLVESGFTTGVVQGGLPAVGLVADSLYKFHFDLKLNAEEPLTEPYWMQYAATTGAYQYDAAFAGIPEAEPRLGIHLTFAYEGISFSAFAPLSYKKLDPVKGDVVQRLRIVPAASLSPFHSLFVFEPGKIQNVSLRLKAFEDIRDGELVVRSGTSVLASLKLPPVTKGRDTVLSIAVPTGKLSDAPDEYLTFSLQSGGKDYNKAQHLIQYPHLPDLQYFTQASMKVLPQTWKTAVKRVGYIEGAGDLVDGILNLCGLTVERVPDNARNSAGYLSRYEAIVVGIRAFNTEKQMKLWMPVLLQYVKEGGTLLVQYNTNQNLVTDQLGPYPLTLSRNRVTEEDAPVRFLQPDAPLLQFPNKITSRDFEGWTQERGIYYPATWDERYQTLLGMQDTGEPELKSAILYTPYGKGQFIYTSLVFFRQLPAGNAGAIRLLMNLLSAGKE